MQYIFFLKFRHATLIYFADLLEISYGNAVGKLLLASTVSQHKTIVAIQVQEIHYNNTN